MCVYIIYIHYDTSIGMQKVYVGCSLGDCSSIGKVSPPPPPPSKGNKKIQLLARDFLQEEGREGWEFVPL